MANLDRLSSNSFSHEKALSGIGRAVRCARDLGPDMAHSILPLPPKALALAPVLSERLAVEHWVVEEKHVEVVPLSN